MKHENISLPGKVQTHPEFGCNSISPIAEPTLSSIEMVDYINFERQGKAEAEGMAFPCKKYRKLRHADFTKKVPKVLGVEYAKNFEYPFISEQNREKYPGYKFPRREACLMAMSYSYELQAKIYDYMEELDRKSNGYLNYSVSELQDIVSRAREVSDEDSSDAGRRLRKRQDDLMTLEKAESVVKSLSQLKLDLILADKNRGVSNV